MKTLVTAITLGFLSTQASADPFAGVRDIEIMAPHHGRSMQAAVWYPAQQGGTPEVYAENAVFYGTEILRDAAPAKGHHPVVLLSHGLGGNIRSLQWLSAGLAARGAVVIDVNHPNSTTGDMDVLAGMNHGTRAQDMSTALDWLQASEFAPMLSDQVMAAGFSFGGWTALSLGGVRGNLDGYATSCDAAQGRSSHCLDLERAGVDLHALDAAQWNADFSDARVTQVAAIDPGLHWGVTSKDVTGLNVPLLLIGLGEGPDRLYAADFSDTGSGFGALVPQAQVELIVPANHFAILPECKPAGEDILKEEKDDPVCTDPEGSDRAAIHAQIIDLLAGQLGL
ncbi:alpha/beta hydrolase family protein [Tropicibacter oceani]|uniref:Dienelactone hydrolase n=1 Tax=Tropicibacter oceani TaxID=3058420 RepID=A0ABY8QJU9_9RHOB|nr:hypothetical protein [Tropicibacter oceani]WGW04890.1 hypothetical protein QF118_04910 [Tropicibacter oceani]